MNKTARANKRPPKSAASGQPTNVADDALARLTASVNLRAVYLVESASKCTPSNDNFLAAESIATSDPCQCRAQQFAEDRTLYCGVKFSTKIHPVAAPGEPIVVLTCEFALLYDLASHEKFDESACLAFASQNAVFNAWPYYREFVQSMVTRMGLPALVLPSLRLGALPPDFASQRDQT